MEMTRMLHRRMAERLTLFHLMMKVKSSVLLGRRAVDSGGGPLQWCSMAAHIGRLELSIMNL